jgi:hypothetical protein
LRAASNEKPAKCGLFVSQILSQVCFSTLGKQPSMAMGARPNILVRAFGDARDAPGIA